MRIFTNVATRAFALDPNSSGCARVALGGLLLV